MIRATPRRVRKSDDRAPAPTGRPLAAVVVALAGLASAGPMLLMTEPAAAQAAPDVSAFSPYDGRPVVQVRIEGLERVSERYARNQLRTVEGQAFSSVTITDDIRRLYSLYEFETVEAAVEPHADGSLTVVFVVNEAPIVQDVQSIGNRRLSDEELAEEVARVNLVSGVPMDRFRIDRARRAIEDLYRAQGYHTVEVLIDEDELANGIVLFRVREGERVRLMATRFEGARSFSEKELRRNIGTKSASLFRKGALAEESLDADVTSLVRFYQSQGYLDVRVDRRLMFAPNNREAIATFIVDEGPRYRLRDVRMERRDGVEEPLIFSPEQVIGLIPTKPGDAYAINAGATAVSAILEAYNRLGYVDADVRRVEMRDPEEPFVDLVIQVSEGERFRVGEVIVQGNTISKQSVIRRHLRFWPDRPLDIQSINESERRLRLTRLFAQPSPGNPAGGVKITLQPEDAAAPNYRDVLVEIEDADTGSVTFLAAVSADAGLIGQIAITERNFDITNPPRGFKDLFSRRGFRGGGQTMQIIVAPGTEIQNYSISLTEPYLFETDTSFSIGGSFRDRIFRDYDEERLRGSLGLGRRFGDRWTASLGLRADSVSLNDLDADAPVDAFAVEDTHSYIGVGLGLTRTTVPPTERYYPTTGSRTELSIEQIFGDFNFTKLSGEYQFFLPVQQDALGRTSVLSFRLAAGWIPQSGEAPIYERYFLGGSSFRGFDFRGVSPRAIANDTGMIGSNPNGGEWSFFFGAEYTQPIYQDLLSLVGFVDTGTVTDDIGFDEYRVSVGVGVRVRVPALGPVPLAFDFGFPVLKQDGDDTRLFTFTADIPF